MTEESWFDIWQGLGIFHYFNPHILAWGPTQPPIPCSLFVFGDKAGWAWSCSLTTI